MYTGYTVYLHNTCMHVYINTYKILTWKHSILNDHIDQGLLHKMCINHRYVHTYMRTCYGSAGFTSMTVLSSESYLGLCTIHFLNALSYCAYPGSFFSYHFRHFLIRSMRRPVDFIYSSPRRPPHFESLQSLCILFPHGPCLWFIQHHTSYTSIFIVRFFRFLRYYFPLSSSPLFENSSFPIATFRLISLWHYNVIWFL